MRATDVMVRDVVTVHPDANVAEAVELLAEAASMLFDAKLDC
jgi:CBS domain-containing protein